MEYTEKIHGKLLQLETRIENKDELFECELENMALNFKKNGRITWKFILMSIATFISLFAAISFAFQQNFLIAGFSIFLSAVFGSGVTIFIISYYLSLIKSFISLTSKIFGEDVWLFFFLFPLKENFITLRLKKFRREIYEAEIPFSMRKKALYERMKYFVEHEYPELKREKIEKKNERLEKEMKNYHNYVSEYSGKDLEMLELEKEDVK